MPGRILGAGVYNSEEDRKDPVLKEPVFLERQENGKHTQYIYIYVHTMFVSMCICK